MGLKGQDDKNYKNTFKKKTPDFFVFFFIVSGDRKHAFQGLETRPTRKKTVTKLAAFFLPPPTPQKKRRN